MLSLVLSKMSDDKVNTDNEASGRQQWLISSLSLTLPILTSPSSIETFQNFASQLRKTFLMQFYNYLKKWKTF